ncbi:hypothetical protein OSB04_023691 [Centaurea solstitialis]|uniref:Helitron helicase-like domain-containing protein n=1 Tax=Centaurea solstitialis TaxID=347529 RepID=A0AA38SLE5_9ASTR|nr:hypothetical protein OSB04_023691 [Centaurea solstitialis]
MHTRLNRKLILIHKKYNRCGLKETLKSLFQTLNSFRNSTAYTDIKYVTQDHKFKEMGIVLTILQTPSLAKSSNIIPHTSPITYKLDKNKLIGHNQGILDLLYTLAIIVVQCFGMRNETQDSKRRVQVPLLREPTEYMQYLMSDAFGQKGVQFRKHIRTYNAMFAFTSMGGRVDSSINNSKGPYVFRMSGQNYRHIGSFIIYMYDTDNEIGNKINTFQDNSRASFIDHEIVHGLSQMLDSHNILAKTFQMARDRFKSSPQSLFRLCLKGNRTTDGRQYNIVYQLFLKLQSQIVIVTITDLHPSFMSLTYPLVHPYGEDGYRTDIPLRNLSNSESKRQNLTMRQYYCFHLQQRLQEEKRLIQGGRLVPQYIVDSYMVIEDERIRWIRNNQTKLRADLYSILMDVVHRGNSDCSTIGKSIILPSSHTEGPRYKAQTIKMRWRFANGPDIQICS